MRLTDKQFWDEEYTNVQIEDHSEHDISIFLNKFLERGENKTALEIGSYPGSFLPTIGKKGYVLNGIDFNEKNATELPEWLKSQNIKVGNFFSGDLFQFAKANKQRYDLVCSFGLIEHFENFTELISLHAQFVKEGGQIIITTPNFRGWLQYLPHRWFDKKNLKKHFLPSMMPQVWKEYLEANGFEVHFAGYFGGYTFWVDRTQHRNGFQKVLLKITEKTISQFKKVFKKLKRESPAYSAFCGVVAKRKIETA